MENVAFVIGLFTTLLGLVVTSRQRRRTTWPTANGSVTSSDVLEVGDFFTGVVRYAYSFGPPSAYRGTAHQHEGRCESEATTRSEAEAHLARYPVGERIDVYVDAARPTRSSLGRSLGREQHSPFGRWLVLAGFMVASTSAVVSVVVRVVEP